MLRRNAIGVLLGGLARGGAKGLERFFDSARASAVLVDARERRLVASGGFAGRAIEPPGSAVKPLVIAALIESGRLKANEAFPCPRRLRIGGRSFDCIHPEIATPVGIDVALAYSCNCFVARVAERFERGELARELERFGLGSATGWFGDEAVGHVRALVNPDEQRMQALGEMGVEVTAAGMAMAYRRLAIKTDAAVLKGMREAVEFGTAQNARVAQVEVAGKTGSAMNREGEPVAWFAGFVPASEPRAVVVVMTPGGSGGADAAPVARRILEAYVAGAL